MKKLNKLEFILIPLMLTLVGCPKPDSNASYTIKGKLVQSCDNPSAVANKNITLDYFESGVLSKNLGKGTTDNNGNFSFTYNSLLDGSALTGVSLGYEAGSADNYVISFPTNSNADVGNIYMQNNFYLVVKIVTDTAYTSNDTLCFAPYGFNSPINGIIYLNGPFYSGQVIDTIITFIPISSNPANNTFLLEYKFPKRNSSVSRNGSSTLVQCIKYNILSLPLHK